jgi:hypothetical protein
MESHRVKSLLNAYAVTQFQNSRISYVEMEKYALDFSGPIKDINFFIE